jgi:hypothetical protein
MACGSTKLAVSIAGVIGTGETSVTIFGRILSSILGSPAK